MVFDRYEQGADLTIMEDFYQYPTKDIDGNIVDDFIAIVYKDNTTGKKYHDIIKKPEYTFYKTKDGISLDHNYLFIENDKVEPVTVPYRNIEKKIAELTGNLDFYKENIRNKNKAENKKLHAIPDIFFSDTSIEDYYRFKFAKRFTNNINKVYKGFFDIEVDTRYMAGDFVEMGECPINAIAYHDEKNDIIISHLLRNPNNPLIEQFENELKTGQFTMNDIKEFIKENIGGYKQYIRNKLDKTKIEIQFFDDEISLLKSFFTRVHTYQPDFIMGWNSSAFDLQYIITRIQALGYEPADIMCDDEWEIKIVKNYIDERQKNNTPERGDYTFISGNCVWIDQMIQYASRRKAKFGSMKSIKLDDIAFEEAHVHKLKYSHITTNIALLPWLNYKIFVLYNIFDVIAQKAIELKAQDIDYIFAKCIVNNTSYKKGHRQTVYLINRMAKEFDSRGYIIGNNANRWNEKPEKYLGALVGDPLNTTDYAKRKINGVPIWVCDNLQDYDYKSLYPNTDLEFNIAPNTQIGRIEIPEKVYEYENSLMNPKYSRGGEFIENMTCDNIIEFCHRWFHLAGFMELLEDWDEYNKKMLVCYSNFGYYNSFNYHNGKVIEVPVNKIIKVPVVFDNKMEKPVIFLETYKHHKGVM